MKIKGRTGQLTAGGRQVVSLLDYTMVQQGDIWQVEAGVAGYNAYWLEHAPQLDLCLTVGREEFVWRGVVPTIGDGRVSATVTGQPEKRGIDGKV